MAIEHWTTAYLTGANASFQRAAREYAEEYAAMAVAEDRANNEHLGCSLGDLDRRDSWKKLINGIKQYAAQEVAAEREKCAGECESEASMWEADGRGVAIEARLCAARIRARSTVTQPTKVQLPYELGPLPARVVVDRHIPTGVVTYGYTDEMVTAYAAEQVAAERERCARRG